MNPRTNRRRKARRRKRLTRWRSRRLVWRTEVVAVYGSNVDTILDEAFALYDTDFRRLAED